MPTADIIGEFYEANPYPHLTNIPHKHLQKYANQLLGCAHLQLHDLKDKTIFDAGCGTGEIACSMALHAKQVIGIDLSKNSIAHAKALAAKHHIHNITFQQQNILESKHKKEFDIVTSFGVLHHTQNPAKAFEIISKGVKPNGILIVGFYHSLGGWKQRLQKWIVGIIAGKDSQKRIAFIEKFLNKKLGSHQRAFWADRVANPREKYYSIKEMKKQFQENGFQLIGIQAHKPEYTIQNPTSAIETLVFELFLFMKGFRFVIMAGKKLE